MTAPQEALRTFEIGSRYNWKGQPERLIYLGNTWIGSCYWHQFAKVDDTSMKVWCEVLSEDLTSFEESK